MSEIGACTWDGFWVSLVTGWPFLQSLLHLYISFRQDKFWVKSFVSGLVSLSFHWGSCWLQEVASSGSPLLRSSALTSGNLPYPRSLELPRDSSLPTPNLTPNSCRFPFILLTFWASLLSLSAPDPASSSPPPVLSLPLPPMTILFPPLSVIQISMSGPSFLFNFFGSVGISWVFCTYWANIHSLVSTYHACHFGSALPHSRWYFLVPSIYLQNS
jgi:hypothetical protein